MTDFFKLGEESMFPIKSEMYQVFWGKERGKILGLFLKMH